MSDLDLTPDHLQGRPTNAYAAEVLEFLAEEGFRPRLDDEGDVSFKYEGSHYYVSTGKEDPTYFQLVYLPFWPIEDAAERQRAHEAASHAHHTIKVGRILVGEHNVVADASAYLPDAEAWRAVFFRYLSGLSVLVRTFREQMHAQLEN